MKYVLQQHFVIYFDEEKFSKYVFFFFLSILFLQGRQGLGNIYVWASGDGGEDDDCNCDGYAASMWTISINSAINDGQNAHYDESCSSTLASTFSNGAKDPNTGVATTDLYGKCTTTHSGTSAAAPEAAGVFALALEAK